MITRIAWIFLTFTFAIPAANAATCYSAREKILARKLLITHPELAQGLKDESNGVWFIEDAICGEPHTITPEQREVLRDLFQRKTWEPLVQASIDKGLSPGRVMIAMRDLTQRPSQ